MYTTRVEKKSIAAPVCWALAGYWGVSCFFIAVWIGGVGLGGYVHTKLDSVFISLGDTSGNQESCLFPPQ